MGSLRTRWSGRLGVSQDVYAKKTGLSIGQIRKLMREDVIVKHDDDSIDEEVSDHNLLEYRKREKKKKSASGNGSHDDVKSESERRRAYYIAEKARIDYEESEGLLVRRDVEERTWFGAARVLRDTLQTAGQRLAPLVVDAVVEAQATGKDPQRAVYQLIRAEHDDALNALATEMEAHGISV